MLDIEAHFRAQARWVTSRETNPSSRVVYAPFEPNDAISGACADVLAPPEMDRAARFGPHPLKAHFLQRRAFQRFCVSRALHGELRLAEIELVHDDKGRPMLPQAAHLHFSFASSSGGFIGAWSHQGSVGVDLQEPVKTIEPQALAKTCFTRRERERMDRCVSDAERADMFYRLWCLKEAALKSIGEGLPFGMDRFEFETGVDARCLSAPDPCGAPKHVSCYEYRVEEAYAALVRLDGPGAPAT